MNFNEAIDMLKEKYEESFKYRWIQNNLAWSLYKVWLKANRDGKTQRRDH